MTLFSNKLSTTTKSALTPEVKPSKKFAQCLFDDTHIQINILIFGPTGCGKTYSLVDLLLMGYKIFVAGTDMGGNGLLTVRLKLKELGKPELLKNIMSYEFSSYDEMKDFLDNPKSLSLDPRYGYSDIYAFNPDFLVWEGFAVFQQFHIYEKINENVVDAASHKSGSDTPSITEAREAGLQFEQQDWGQLRNATIKALAKFFAIHNPKTGKVWHKIVTSHEKEQSVTKQDGKQKTSMIVEMKQPLLQGAAQSLVAGGFDLIIRASKETSVLNKDTYYYNFRDNSSKWSKDRGFGLDKMEANMGKLWNIICEKASIQMGAISEDLKTEKEN